MNTPLFHTIARLLVGGVLLISIPAFAQEDGGDSASAESTAISQGRSAILLANSLGLYANQVEPLTPTGAVQLLMAHNIAPFGGWKVNTPMSTGDLARVLVQWLGLDEDFTEEEVNDPTSQAYKDILLAEYDVDVDNLVADGVAITSGDNTGDTEGTGTAETTIPSEQDILVDEEDLNAAIAATVPTQGGSGGQVDGGSEDVTPSAP